MPPRRVPAAVPVVAMATIAGLLLLGCGDDGVDTSAPTTSEPAASTTVPATTVTTTTVPTTTVAPIAIDETSFVNINDMTAVRGFFVDNLLGDLDATLAVAESPDGGVYPPGSVVQLVPAEAMVKREPGFSPDTNDWEFFELVTSVDGTVINVRGGAEAVNSFGLSCADCHARAEPQWDFICEQDHGCDPLPLTRELIETLQAGDPRPRAR